MRKPVITWDGIELPTEVVELVEAFLPIYKEDRQRWPLWTQGPLAPQLRWEPVFEVYRWTSAYLYSQEFPEYALHGSYGVQNLRAAAADMGTKKLAIFASIAASMALETPSTAGGIMLLDDRGPTGRPIDIGAELEARVLKTVREMFVDLLMAHDAAAFPRARREEKGVPHPLRPKDLAMEFCKKAGLMVDRRRGVRIGLRDHALAELRREIEDVIGVYSRYSPSAPELDGAREVLLNNLGIGYLTGERLRRGFRRFIMPFLYRMRLPFLTSRESRIIQGGLPNTVETGLKVLAKRLPGEVAPETIRNRTAPFMK